MRPQEKEILKHLNIPKDIVIVGHRNPDGDALGSCLGLRHFLEKLGHFCTVVFPSEYPKQLGFLKGAEEAMIYDLDASGVEGKIDRADMIFCLDFNALDRVDKVGELIEKSEAIRVLIDHHLDPMPFADYMYSDTAASSTAELVFYFIELLGKKDRINLAIGEALFTGIVTDTGSFRYGTRAYTYTVAAELKERGVNDYHLMNLIFNSMKEKQLRLLGHCLANRMKIYKAYSSAMIYLNRQDYYDYDIQRGDTEGIVNYMLMMKDVKMAAFITEQPSIIKISLRSKDDINVQEIASNHFKGGGHKNASGGGVYASLEDVIKRFEQILPRYMDKVEI